MNYLELANFIRKNYTPLVFSCDCNGSHPDCASALDDRAVWAQRDTVNRIVQMLLQEWNNGKRD